MSHCSRRNFLKTGLAAGVLAGAGSLPVRAAGWNSHRLGDAWKVGRQGDAAGVRHRDRSAEKRSATWGRTDFTKLVRYAYDRGIRFFETAESYGDMHKMLGVALKGIPRDSYRLMSKVTTRTKA